MLQDTSREETHFLESSEDNVRPTDGKTWQTIDSSAHIDPKAMGKIDDHKC